MGTMRGIAFACVLAVIGCGPPSRSEAEGGIDASVIYPMGPYGDKLGSIIDDMSWTGYKDTTADADADPFNEAAHDVKLDDYLPGHDPGSSVLLVSFSAEWCEPCVQESTELPAMLAEWGPKGARALVILIETESHNQPTTDDLKMWGQKFQLTNAVAFDQHFETFNQVGGSGLPLEIFVETSTMKIVDRYEGYDPNRNKGVFYTYAH